MEIPVLIEPVPPNGFRARSGEPLGLTAEGATREEALQKLREMVTKRIADGAEMTSLEVGPFQHPWARFAGTWADDDPVIAEWEKEWRRTAGRWMRTRTCDEPLCPRHGHRDALPARPRTGLPERSTPTRPAELAITVLTVEEQLSGWYAWLRRATQPSQLARGYQELADAVAVSRVAANPLVFGIRHRPLRSI